MEKYDKIVLFDGYCNFCNSSVQFILKHEKTPDIKFCSLKSDVGIALLNKFHLNTTTIDSMVYIEHTIAYIKSDAALRLSKQLNGIYPLAYGFIIIPKFIRNWVYDFIAKNRYKWFGKSISCYVPNEQQKNRFLA